MRNFNLQFFSAGKPTPAADPVETNGDKIFTQEDVNRIISERLTKEKNKINVEREAAYSKREEDLQQRELKLKAREVLSEHNLPNELLDALNYSNEEVFLKSIDIIKKHISPQVDIQVVPQKENIRTIYTPHGGYNSMEVDNFVRGLRKS